MMKFMMMSSLFGDAGAGTDAGIGTGISTGIGIDTGISTGSGALAAQNTGNMNLLLPLMLMKSGGFDDLFGNLFEEDTDAEDAADAEEDDEEDTVF